MVNVMKIWMIKENVMEVFMNKVECDENIGD